MLLSLPILFTTVISSEAPLASSFPLLPSCLLTHPQAPFLPHSSQPPTQLRYRFFPAQGLSIFFLENFSSKCLPPFIPVTLILYNHVTSQALLIPFTVCRLCGSGNGHQIRVRKAIICWKFGSLHCQILIRISLVATGPDGQGLCRKGLHIYCNIKALSQPTHLHSYKNFILKYIANIQRACRLPIFFSPIS